MFIHDWNRQICLECLSCVQACPNGNLTQYEGRPTASAINTCVGCSHCRTSCPTKAISFHYVGQEGYNKDTLGLKLNIQQMAKTGKNRIEGMGTRRRFADLDDLVFLPGQLFQPPLLEEEKVDTTVILGKKAARKIKLDIPIMIGAMSFGALSKEAKIALAKAATSAGTLTNSGEGGMLPEEREAAKYYALQYSTGRFGITEETLKKADMVEIKVGQGAKPGLGGHLLKDKITPEIAKVRNIDPKQNAISPSRHPDINSKEDLKRKVDYLKEITNGAPIGIKFAGGRIEKDLEYALFAGVDVITVDGMEGGTGAAPIAAKDHAGLPMLNTLCRAARFIEQSGKKDDVTLVAAGGLRTGADFAKAFALGAEAVYIASSAQISMGCVRCRACHSGKCPAGICTHNGNNVLNVDEASQGVVNFLHASMEDVVMICRLVGKNAVRKLGRDDMASLDEETARITGVQPG